MPPVVLNYKLTFPESYSEEDKKAFHTPGHRCTHLIVLVHGLTSAHQTFLNVLEPMANQTKFPVLAVDLRGHGRSPEAPITEQEQQAQVAETSSSSVGADYTIKSMAADIAATIFANKTDPQALKLDVSEGAIIGLGHSWGSRCMLQFAADYPSVVKGIIVEDEYIRAEDVNSPSNRKGPAITDTENSARCYKMMQKWNSENTNSFNSEEEVAKFLESICGPASTLGLENYSRKIGQTPEGKFFPLFKPHVAFTFDEYARKADMNFIWKNEEGKYNFPIHIMCGDGTENGADVSKEDFEILQNEANAMRNRSVTKIPGCGHVIHRTHTDEFFKDFLMFVTTKVV